MREIENDFGRGNQTYTICSFSGSMLYVSTGWASWFRWIDPMTDTSLLRGPSRRALIDEPPSLASEMSALGEGNTGQLISSKLLILHHLSDSMARQDLPR
jgi:hypothetical protein